MTIPKMPERMPINLIGNDVTYTRDCIKWAGGFNQCHNELTAWVVGRLNKLPYKDNVEIQALIKELKDGK